MPLHRVLHYPMMPDPRKVVDETHEYCPRNTLGASLRSARETVIIGGYAERAVDEVTGGDHNQVCEGLRGGV